MKRVNPLVTGEYYHIINKSIASFKIFNNEKDYLRMLNLVRYYQIQGQPVKFSNYLKSSLVQKIGFQKAFSLNAKDQDKIIEIIAYCLMPTHIHLILKQLKDVGISLYMRKVLDSYSRYFNLNHRRNGPLWENRFKNILVETDEQLLHLTRYIHLNPTTALLVKQPAQWKYSSYSEYINKNLNDPITNFNNLNTDPRDYKKFTEDRVGFQQELAKIKHLVLD